MASRSKSTSAEADDLPKPKETYLLVGHAAAEGALLASLASGRMPHAWLITGPRGVGKATLAFRLARFLLKHGRSAEEAARRSQSLGVAEDETIVRHVAQGAAQDLLIVRRPVDERTGAQKAEIPVDEMRRLQPFFALAAGGGGWRIAIIDAIDEANRNAANAVLKILEEPPARSVLLLIAHRAGGVLATIRSRCRRLDLAPLDDAAVLAALAAHAGRDLAAEERQALLVLAGGSPGRAAALARMNAGRLYLNLLALIANGLPPNPRALQKFAEAVAGAGDGAVMLLRGLLGDLLWRAAREGVSRKAPSAPLTSADPAISRLLAAASAARWAERAGEIDRFLERGEDLNLDDAGLIEEALRRLLEPQRGQAA